LVNAPDPCISDLPDISPVINSTKEVSENYAQQVGFVLPAVGNAQRTAAAYDYPNRMLTNANGDVSQPASVYTYMITGAGLAWAKRTISTHATDLRYTFTTPEKTRDKLGPHCDRSRWYSLIYLLDSGGDNHYTAFYKEKNQNLLERDFGYHVDNYTQLDEIYRLQIPLKRWVLLNTRILHSAENITGTRISYHVSFGEFPADIQLENPVYL
jgi:hypothetical protein